MTAAELQVIISAQTEELQAGMQRAAAAVESSTAQIDAAFVSANEAVETFEASLKALQNVAVFAIFVEGAQKIRELVSSINEGEVALLHMSARTGVAVGELHGLSVALEATGASGSSFERGMRMIETRLEAAAMQSTSAQDKFAALGLTWKSLRGLNAEQLFFAVADAVANMREGTDKAGAVIGLLGARFGTQLLPALNMGSAGLKQIIALENQLNPVTQQAAEDANKLHVQWLALGESSNSLARSMAHELRGALSEVYTEVLNLEGAFIELKTFISEGGLTSWSFSGIKKAFHDATQAGLHFVAHATDMAKALAKVQAAGQVAPPDVAMLKGGGITGAEAGPDPEKELMLHLEARQREIKAEADAELRIWTEAAKNVQSVNDSQFALQAAQIKAAASLHTITSQQEADQLIELDQRELASKLTTINNEIAALQQAGVQEKDYYDKIAALQAQAVVLQNQTAAKIVQIQATAATQSEAAWNQFGSSIVGQFNSVVSQLTTGTATLRTVMQSIFTGILSDFTRLIESMIAETALFKGIEAAIKGLFGIGTSAVNPADAATVQEKAALAGATMFADVIAAVPFPANLAVAPAMAAAAEASVHGLYSFDMGGIVPGGNFGIPAIVHPGEMVLPAHISEGIQNAIAGGGFGGGGGDVHVHINITAMDGTDAHRVIMANADSIGQAVAKSVRGGSMQGRNLRGLADHLRR